MKKLLFILFLLCSFPALADDSQLPEKYLGFWHPLSKTVAYVGIDIRNDGQIYEILDVKGKKKKYMQLKNYRFLGELKDKDLAYIAVHLEDNTYPDTEILQLHIETEDSHYPKEQTSHTLLVNSGCEISLETFANALQQTLFEKALSKECGFHQDPHNEGDLHTYHRYQPK